MTKRFIVLFIPPKKIVNGGILSIFSICNVSREFKDIHKADVYLATYPGTKSYGKNDLFNNDEEILSFDEIVKKGNPDFLQLHVPEYASAEIYKRLKQKYIRYLELIPDLRVNILNQNIELMQQPSELANWLSLTPKLTQTIAHDKYSTQKLADLYGIPSHHLSTFVDYRQFRHTPYVDKKDMVVFSEDSNTFRESVIQRIKNELPEYKTLVIKNMKYEKYKEIIKRAKFTITFGEGFDGYYVETFFSGGIALAVYNESFFPSEEFKNFENIYSDYREMLANIVSDIKILNDKSKFDAVNSRNLRKINALYSYENYKNNIRSFYLDKFTFLPSKASHYDLMKKVVQDKEKLLNKIENLGLALSEKDKLISDRDSLIASKESFIAEILDSKSWKVTKPLRAVASRTKKKD